MPNLKIELKEEEVNLITELLEKKLTVIRKNCESDENYRIRIGQEKLELIEDLLINIELLQNLEPLKIN